MKTCWRHKPERSVFDAWRILDELLNQNINYLFKYELVHLITDGIKYKLYQAGTNCSALFLAIYAAK